MSQSLANLANLATVFGFIICIATALVLAFYCKSEEPDA
jgi:hypothetical protein